MCPTTGNTPPPEVIAYSLHGNCYLNITWHCSLRCDFCPKFNGNWMVQDYDLRLHREPSADEIVDAIGDPSQYNQIVFCGLGEPTLRLDTVLEVAKKIRPSGVRIRINTDGLANLVHGRDVSPRFAGLIDSLAISMNAQNEDIYNRHCRPKINGAYPAMLDFAQLARRHVDDVSLSAIDGLEGVDIQACTDKARSMGLSFRRRILDIVG